MTEVLSRPRELAAAVSLWLPRHRKSAGTARAEFRRYLADARGGELLLDVGELLLAELVSNAIRHAHVPPGRLILVRFGITSDLLQIEVHDASDTLPTVRRADTEAEVGRGLWLVEQLSADWGCCARTGVGKAVWCLVTPTDSRGTSPDVEEANQ